MIELRPYQQECIEAIETAAGKGTTRPLVALPTGTGKTIVFSTLAKRRGGRTLILAHRDELIEQAVDKMLMVWDSANIGVVKAERNELDRQVIVGSVQTVSRENRLEQLPTDFDLVITDEAHHCHIPGTFVRTATGYKAIERLGVGHLVYGWDENNDTWGLYKVTNAFRYWYEGHILSVKTETGFGVSVTPNHKLYSDGRRIYARQIKQGQSLSMPPLWLENHSGSSSSPVESWLRDRRVVTCFPTPSRSTQREAIVCNRVADYPNDQRRCSIWEDNVCSVFLRHYAGWVYDIEVQDVHNYIANGVLSSNSAAVSYRRIYEHLGVYSPAEGEGSYGASDTLHLGVTATPNRTDKIGLTPIFQEIVYQKRILDMIPDYLCDLRCVRVLTHINVDGVSTWAGDLRAEQLSELLNTENCNELIVEAWKEHALGRLTLCFTTDVAHARDLCSMFQAANINAAWVSGETPTLERRDILAKFAQREIEVVTNCNVLTEGYDNPAIDCIVIVRPTKSTLLYQQMIGRGTRTFPGKKDCLIVDVACISTQHDLVSFPSLFGLPLKQDGEKTLTEQVEEKENKLKIYGDLRGQGIEREEVDIFGRKPQTSDPYSMGNLAWVQLPNGFRLYLGKHGVINIYSDFTTPMRYQVFYRSYTEKRRLTTSPVELSWAFGLAESEARRITGGNLTLVDRNARWRQDPASDKQIAKLAELGVYRTNLTKGEASDLLSQLFAQGNLSQ